MRRITLLTDFGTADGYAAAMKGVIASICPEAIIDDASHDIPPGDIEGAAWVLSRYWREYPEGTVHVVVVDPGVGSERRALALRADGRLLVAPDNGVLTRVMSAATWEAVSIQERRFLHEPVSRTFHGRDVFAPAAAHLARGTALHELGPAVADPALLPLPEPTLEPHAVRGTIVHVDRFGNAVTNIPESQVGDGAVVCGGRNLGRLRSTYADVAPAALLALIGSAGTLEISVRDGSAAQSLGLKRGDEVVVER